MATSKEKEKRVWEAKDIDKQMKLHQFFNSEWNPKAADIQEEQQVIQNGRHVQFQRSSRSSLDSNASQQIRRNSRQSLESIATDDLQEEEVSEDREEAARLEQERAHRRGVELRAEQLKEHVQKGNNTAGNSRIPYDRVKQTPQQSLPPRRPPPRPNPGPPTNPKLLSDLSKSYFKDENKYSGDLYDILDLKLQIFYDFCNKLQVGIEDYHNAVSYMLKGRASTFYYSDLASKGLTFEQIYVGLVTHFETKENMQEYLKQWRETTLTKVIAKNPTKTRIECLELLLDRLRIIHFALGDAYKAPNILRDNVLSACRGIPECNYALFNPGDTFEAVCAQLRSSVGTAMAEKEAQQFHQQPQTSAASQDSHTCFGKGCKHHQHYTDRKYFPDKGGKPHTHNHIKKCFICGKEGCWSTKHTTKERADSLAKVRAEKQIKTKQEINLQFFATFLVGFEGMEGLMEEELDEADQLLQMMDTEFDLNRGSQTNFFTEMGEVEGDKVIYLLNSQSEEHALTASDMFDQEVELSIYSTGVERYSDGVFRGILPDTGAAGHSTVGHGQLLALQKLDPTVEFSTATAGDHKFRFGKGSCESIGTATVRTPIGEITFQVVTAATPFLLSIEDMDRLKVELHNLENVLTQGDKVIPVVRRWGHPWMMLHNPEEAIAWSHLTEPELRRIHRRFGHPSVRRLLRILQRAGYDVETEHIKRLTKLCHQCQKHSKGPGRFKFSLKDDHEFNYTIIIDIMYIDGGPVLHVVDSATAFQAAKWLSNMQTKTVWDVLRLCWIDTYQGPPNRIVTDAGTNLTSDEFKLNSQAMSIEVTEVPVEAHNRVGKAERAHAGLRRAYQIIKDELRGTATSKEGMLQMPVKAANDSAGPDGIVPTLLVFGAYPRMSRESPPSITTQKRGQAVRKAMAELRVLHSKRQVQGAVEMRNGPDTFPQLDLPLQSDVLVYRETKKWEGPYKLIAIERETCIVELPSGPTKFSSVVVRPYYNSIEQEFPEQDPELAAHLAPEESPNAEESGDESDAEPIRRSPRHHRLGRWSRNQLFLNDVEPEFLQDFENQYLQAIEAGEQITMGFMTHKEKGDLVMSVQLRKDGIITTPGVPFEVSRTSEIDGLLGRGVFQFEVYNKAKHGNTRIFKSRMIDEIKGKTTEAPFEESRLVIQAYNDQGKAVILTQSPTIQRSAQRLMVALMPSVILIVREGGKIEVWLRDITQAYTQADSELERMILAYLPSDIAHLYPPGTIMRVVEPLYGIPEAGTHWWATYSGHHKEKLQMEVSTYDPCLLITKTPEAFGVVGMQTDDTLIIADAAFSAREQEQLDIAKFTAKPKDKLTTENPLLFNGCTLSLFDDNTMYLKQKGQGAKLKEVDLNAEPAEFKDQYLRQRARGAYIALICQPEAAYDYSVAAQHQDPTQQEAIALNKRIKWQLDNLDRGLKYVNLDLGTAKIMVFVDGSFANNKDFSSQIGYVIAIVNESQESEEEFDIKGNIITYSSTKSRRVTRSVLASEVHGMVEGIDLLIAISTTLDKITDQLGLPRIPAIVATDSYSLYECLVKLGTTQEKRLMIDIMAIRQSYERREVFEIRWINGMDNPADAMTKANPNKALQSLVETNKLKVRVDGWVKRDIEPQGGGAGAGEEPQHHGV